MKIIAGNKVNQAHVTKSNSNFSFLPYLRFLPKRNIKYADINENE